AGRNIDRRRGDHRDDLLHPGHGPHDRGFHLLSRFPDRPGRRARPGAAGPVREPRDRPDLRGRRPAHSLQLMSVVEVRATPTKSGSQAQRPATSAVTLREGPAALFRRFLAVRLAWLGLVVLLGMLFLAATADWLTPYDPNLQSYTHVLQPPDGDHPLGTDEIGPDVYSRVVYGTRVSLEVGLISVTIGLVVGSLVGLFAGYGGGLIDEGLMRVMDGVWAFPPLILALAVTAALGQGITNTMIAIGLVYIPAFARLTRAQALSVRERDFIAAARVSGASPWRIMLRHVWPNVTAPIVVQASLLVAGAIITEASLSFL